MIYNLLKLFLPKSQKENRLIRDFEIFDTILTKEKTLIFIDPQRQSAGSYIISTYCVINNKKHDINRLLGSQKIAEIISKKH